MSNNEIRYGVAALNALMGTRGDISRISLLGKPALNSNLATPDKARTLAEGDDASCDVDFGLQFIELRADGLYVKGETSSSLLQDEFSAITGDWKLTRRTGMPLLPIPFTARELLAIEAALGIVERLQAGDDTDIQIGRVRRNDADAGDLAEWLMRGAQEIRKGFSGEAQAPTSDELAEEVQELPRFNMTRAAMIAAHSHEWETIEADLKSASENGLSRAKAGVRGWHESVAMEWARCNGKLLKPSAVSTPLMPTLDSLSTIRHRQAR